MSSLLTNRDHLSFNADKTQFIKFPKRLILRPPLLVLSSLVSLRLSLSNAINHLGHILTHNLSDDEDIIAISKDMCRKANHLLHIFPCRDLSIKTQLFLSFCLSLYGAALWRVSCPQLRSLEVSFNNILRKIWSLPRQSHTGIVHSVAGLQSIYNIVLNRSRKLIASATKSKCTELFSECAVTAFTSFGYNHLYGCKPHKLYTEDVRLCADFIRDARMNPAMNKHLDSDIHVYNIILYYIIY